MSRWRKRERALAREHRPVGADQLLADERQQRLARRSDGSRTASSTTDASWKTLPSTAAASIAARSSSGSTVEARGQERLDRRRHLAQSHPRGVVLEQEREHLLDEERVSARSLDDCCRARSSSSPGRRGCRGASRSRPRTAARAEPMSRSAFPAAPLRPHLEQLGPGDADEEDRCVARPVGDVVDEVEKCRLAPVDVVEDEHERPAACERLDERPDRPERLLGAAHVGPRARRPRRAAARRARRPRPRRASAASLARFSSGRVGSSRPAASRTASSTGQYVIPSPYGRQRPRATMRFRRDVVDELTDEPRLPDARRSENREELAGPVADRLLERVVQSAPLTLAADHRRVEAAHRSPWRPGGRATSRRCARRVASTSTESGRAGASARR